MAELYLKLKQLIGMFILLLDPGSSIDSRPTPNIARPAYLQPIVDPTFGHTVIRITEAGQPIHNPFDDPSLVGRNWADETGHGYSSRVAWNADQSLLWLDKGVGGNLFLDGASYQPLFRRRIPGAGRWHPTDPDVMLFVDRSEHCVSGYAPRNDAVIWRRCFSGFRTFQWSDPGKAKPSTDGNIIPVRAQRSNDQHWVAFLYYINTNSTSAVIDMSRYVDTGDQPDFTMSPLGDVIIINGCILGHEGRCEAQLAIDVATQTELWRVLSRHNPGHADELLDQAGQQWRIGVAKAGSYKGHVIKRNFRTGEAVSLVPYWGSHTSTRNISDPTGKVIITYSDAKGPLRYEIVGVCPDGSCIRRYAHTHRFADGRYLAENQASVSPFGDKIVFRSNWDVENGPIDAYVIELPRPR